MSNLTTERHRVSNFDVFVLMGQRKCRYEGQYDLEALAVMDEAGNSDNPDFLRDMLDENRNGGEFEALAIVRLTVDRNAVMSALFPSEAAIPAIGSPA